MAAAASAAASLDWLSSLQAQFLEGTFTDLTIRVWLGPGATAAPAAAAAEQDEEGQEETAAAVAAPTKRRKCSVASSAGGAAATAARPAAEIRCHANVLSARSPYFRTCLSGEWREAQARTIEVELADEQELADFRLVLKLSYGPSYTKDGDEPLDRATRLRLAVLADAYEVADYVRQCLESLAEGMTFEDAIDGLSSIPRQLHQHPAADVLKEKQLAALAAGFREYEPTRLTKEDEALLCRAGDVLAERLGPVHALFSQSSRLYDYEHYENLPFYRHVSLKPAVKELPFLAMKYLLRSEKLQCLSENEPFFLLCAWHSQQLSYLQNPAELKALLKLIRFRHMEDHYLANVASFCPLLTEVAALPWIMSMAVARRNCDGMGEPRAPVHMSRGLPLSEAKWHIQTSIALDECLEFGPSRRAMYKYIGLMAGYPLQVAVRRQRIAMPVYRDGISGWEWGDYFKLDLDVDMPFLPHGALHMGPFKRSIMMAVKFRLGGDGGWTSTDYWFIWGEDRYGGLMYNLPWEDVVREGSPYFPDGEMKLELRIKVLPEWRDEDEDDDDDDY